MRNPANSYAGWFNWTQPESHQADDELIERWQCEDDPERADKWERLRSSPCYKRFIESRKAVWKRFHKSKPLPDLLAEIQFNHPHLKWLRFKFGLSTSLNINTPERLLWKLRLSPERWRELLYCTPLGRAVPESEYHPFLKQCSALAVKMRQANPKLPRVPEHQAENPDAWWESLCQWCIDAQAIIDKPTEPPIDDSINDSPLSPDAPDEWMKLTEAAKLLGHERAPSYISKLLDQGELTDNGKTGKPRRVRSSSVAALLAKRMKREEDADNRNEYETVRRLMESENHRQIHQKRFSPR